MLFYSIAFFRETISIVTRLRDNRSISLCIGHTYTCVYSNYMCIFKFPPTQCQLFSIQCQLFLLIANMIKDEKLCYICIYIIYFLDYKTARNISLLSINLIRGKMTFVVRTKTDPFSARN